jgi:uncharacterized protein (TIGR00251 family)
VPETRFTVRVRPGASRTQVGGGYGDPPALIVAVSAPAVDGRANDAVVLAIAGAFDIRPRAVRIVSGTASRTKVVAIDVDMPDPVAERLAGLLSRT